MSRRLTGTTRAVDGATVAVFGKFGRAFEVAPHLTGTTLGRVLESYGCTWQHGPMIFEVIGEITAIEVIAVGSSIHDIERLRKTYGSGRWRKLKGFALVHLEDGTESAAELHWYEAHGLGKKEMKVKEVLE